MKNITYCIIDENYWETISKTDKNIPKYEKYKSNEEYKPFFQTLFNVGDLCYVACLSKKKKKHYNMHSSIDFLKVFIENSRKRSKYMSQSTPLRKNRFFISVVNLNNMFPVPKTLLKEIEFESIDEYRKFKDNNEKNKYITLFKKEAKALNQLNIKERAEHLYNVVCNYGDKEENQSLVQRCVNFKKAEQFALSYISADHK